MACGCSHNTTGTAATCMGVFHVCAHCQHPGHSATTCRSRPARLAETRNLEGSDASVTEAVDAAPVGTTPPVEPEPPNSQFSFPICGQTQQGLSLFFRFDGGGIA